MLIHCVRGSSPRIRGKQDALAERPVGRGLIPAHTGKTLPYPGAGVGVRAHPRAYGENKQALGGLTTFLGSSPRIRGKPALVLRGAVVVGLTPAHTGKTAQIRRRPFRQRAHPRAYGENSASLPSLLISPGSSPRIRGKHEVSRLLQLGLGLIPAHTGKTACE